MQQEEEHDLCLIIYGISIKNHALSKSLQLLVY